MRGPVLGDKNVSIIYMHIKNLGQSSHPIQFSVKKNIIYIQIKHLGWRTSCPAQFSKAQYHLHTDKKFRAKIFLPFPVFCNYHLHPYKKFEAKKFLPCPVLCKKKIYHLHHLKKFRGKKFSPCPVLCNKNIICIHLKT